MFENIKIYPQHGSRSAVVTWSMEAGADAGDVYVAFSTTGTEGSWDVRNANDPVPSALGMYEDVNLVMDSGVLDGFYKLMITTVGGVDHFSKPVQILGYLSEAEYGEIKAMIYQEYTQMRVTNGFPVWHCIPRSHGEPADNVDPDTGKVEGLECDLGTSDMGYGTPFKGGFYPPVLTWLRVIAHAEGLKDDPDEFSLSDVAKTSVRMMAFPRPRREHMIVDPMTDRRYLVSDEVKPYRHRGIIAIAYQATLEFLQQSDPRYKFPVPEIDVKAQRRLPDWKPLIFRDE